MRRRKTPDRTKRLEHQSFNSETYEPYIHYTDFSSSGQVHRARSKSDRVCQLLSKLEYQRFIKLNFRDNVVDVFEQFALDLDATVRIAKENGLYKNHPKDPKTGEPAVMTTDLVVRRNDGRLEAYDVKPSSKAYHPRVANKRRIEEIYWQEVSDGEVTLTLLTEEDIGRVLVRNIEILNGIKKADPALLEHYGARLNGSDLSLREFNKAFELEWAMEPGTGSLLFKNLVRERMIPFDLENTDIISKEVQDACWKDLQCE